MPEQPSGLGALVTSDGPISTDFRPTSVKAREGRARSTPISAADAARRARARRRGGKKSSYWYITLPWVEKRAADKMFRRLLQPPHWANAEDRRARREALDILRVVLRGMLEDKDKRRVGGRIGYRRGKRIILQLEYEPADTAPQLEPSMPSSTERPAP